MDDFNKRLNKRLEDDEFKLAWNEYENKLKELSKELMVKHNMSEEEYEEFIDKWNSLDNINAVVIPDKKEK